MFNTISNDSYILSIYQYIADNPDDNCIASHDIAHIKNVVHTIQSVLQQLDFDDKTIENAKIAAFLHDIGMKHGKRDHAQKSYEMAREYFTDNLINTGANEEILEAIKYHSNGLENNFIASALAFADKLDIKYTRITELGKREKGNRQYYYIYNIVVKVTSNNLKVMFLVDNKCNKQELEEYYFTKKVFKAITNFAKIINRTPLIYFNDNEWILE